MDEEAAAAAARGAATHEVTDLLRAWRAGDSSAQERLMALLYDELQRVARRQLARERRGGTLETTALVHEAYLRLVDQRRVDWHDRGHFLALAATMMRRVLVDRARARHAGKRAHLAVPITLAEAEGLGAAPELEVLDVDRALGRLAERFPRPARVVEMRFFAGLELVEIAGVLGVTDRTVKRDWSFARAWLARELAGGPAR